ncbi:M48 family metalloprotease [Roseivirga echinicomitans]|uniref:Peptidase M48 domain-containing protein n=1 Tax=Roseivirga echinicomitans TaxID=296218 RepID=A0A150XXC9_9BACT|nr:hypothetical protein [Roseivirga echinicomitans]KYG83429.1 hypothetical protein AWN68_01090 [Roseivirga echinicomitans]
MEPLLLNTFGWKKKIPEEIRIPTLIALSHYPELKGVKIEFRFAEKKSKSVMSARPSFRSVFGVLADRTYVIYVRRRFVIEGKLLRIEELPQNILVGWIGHELGHIMDYKDRSVLSLLGFGLGYLILGKYVRAAERRADEFAVRHGLRSEILETKNFILNNTHLPERYKNKIKRLYLSPEEIMEIVNTDEEEITKKLASV